MLRWGGLDIERADDAAIALVEHVGVDQGGFDVAMTEEFLDGADVVAVLEEVGGEGVAEGMTTDALGDGGRSNGLFEGFLESAFVKVIALPFKRDFILNAFTGWKDPLPLPHSIGIGIFTIQGKR